MKVIVFVKATKSSEAGELPSEELMAAMGKFNEELFEAGIMKSGEGLKPSSEAKRVHFSGKTRTVIDGPFVETKELVAGYWEWEVASMDEAVEWVKKCPNPMPEDSEIEIRPIYEMEDFEEIDKDGTFQEHEEGLRSKVATQECLIQPYLFFGGRCEEALKYYEQALGAKVLMKMRFSESPESLPEGKLQAGFENKIMHSSFQIGQMTVMASDGCNEEEKMNGVRLVLSLPTKESCDLAFNALADSGNIEMPLGETFWSPRFGMVTDQFGVQWMVTVPGESH